MGLESFRAEVLKVQAFFAQAVEHALDIHLAAVERSPAPTHQIVAVWVQAFVETNRVHTIGANAGELLGATGARESVTVSAVNFCALLLE